jgi:hypothetical protein
MADKFRKTKSNFATTLVTGIGTGTGDTITLNSTTGLPTDTEITLTFNRVTSGGVVNSTSVMERITGTISGATLTSYTRGVDGTTEQAHAGGVVVEYIPNAADINDQVDGILVGHNQDGTHKSGSVLTLPQINDTSSDHQYVVAVNELTADRTVTLPLLTANDTFVFRNHSNVAINFNAPEGFLINGKIVPSVANNDLTVALKGLDGNDPSATNPVYCRIGDTVHAITAALSVTKADGTNWFNAGSAELATKEIDYFVYLGYNATDGVVIGFSRIPYATQYDQFSATTTNEKYCAISTISNAAAGDDYTVIGRFAATLSAGAGYTWTVPTFTTINLIQRPIFETRELTFVPTVSYAGGSANPTSLTVSSATYKVESENVYPLVVYSLVKGTGNRTHCIFTIPFTPKYSYIGGSGATTWGVYNLTSIDTAPRILNFCPAGMANDGNGTASGWYKIA